MSQKRVDFETALRNKDWETAVDNLNALNMPEMLATLDALRPPDRAEVLKQAEQVFVKQRSWTGSFERIRFAQDVVESGNLTPPASLTDARQVNDAKIFLFLNRGRTTDVTNHTGMTVDLLAELFGRSSDRAKRVIYKRVLDPDNNVVGDRSTWDSTLADQPLKQNTNPGQFNCGDVTPAFFGQAHCTVSYGTAYYQTPTSDRLADLRMKSGILLTAMNTFRDLIGRQKKAVRLFVVHHNGFTIPVIRNTPVTHFLTLIGFSADKFLYVDPWPGGSSLTYTSGIFGDVESKFMGLMQLVGDRLQNITTGVHSYVVIAGP